MAVGKPNFNLNSYGIKYFQKGDDLQNTERQDLDSQQDKVNTVTTGGLEQPTKLDTQLGSINNQLNAGQNNKPKVSKPKFKPSKAKVKPNMTAEQEAKFDKISAESKRETSGNTFSKTPTQNAKPDKKTNYYYNKPTKVNHYLGDKKQDSEVALSPVIGGVKTDHAPDDVPKGESAREAWNKAHPKAAKKLGNRSRTSHAAETRKPSSGKGAREAWLEREGVGEDDDDNTSHKNKVPLDEQGSDNKAIRGVKGDLKNVKNEPNISDEDKKDLIGDNKKVTVNDDKKGTKGNASELYEKIHGHKYTEKPEKSEEEKRYDYRQELLGNLNEQEKQREEAKKKEKLERAARHRGGVKTRKEERRGETDGDEEITTEEAARRNAADKETDKETTSRGHTGKYRDVQGLEEHGSTYDASNRGYRENFDREEAMDIAHKRTAERTTAKEDEKDKKAKEKREAILDHVGDKKENPPSLKPASSRTMIGEGNQEPSNVSIQHTEDKVNEVTGKTIPATQTKEQAATNEKVRQVNEVTEMEKEKERKAEAKETIELKHDEKGNWKKDYTPTAEEKAKKKKERLERQAAAAKKKEKPKTKKTKKKEPESKLSEEQMKKLLEESSARDKNKDKNKTANDIIMDMAILKLDLMKDAKDGKGSNKPMFGSDDIEYGGDTFSNDRALTREENYLETYGGDDEPTGTTLDKLGEVEDIKFKNPKQADKYLNAPNMTKKQPIKPKIASAASETIFKAISLKLDLSKDL